MITDVHFVSFSPCGGTEKVMQALGRSIMLSKHEHNITLPKNRLEILQFNENDLVFLGFPVYGGRMPRFFSELISTLQGENTPLAMVAVYGNREYEGAFLDMHPAMSAKGFQPIAAVAAIAEHSLSPRIAANRPDTDDNMKLAEYGTRILEKARKETNVIEPPGEYPKWKISSNAAVFVKTDTSLCNTCGACVKVCPNAAIPAEAPQTTVVEKCMICAACIKHCPQKARALGVTQSRKEMASHLDNAVVRKEPALFA